MPTHQLVIWEMCDMMQINLTTIPNRIATLKKSLKGNFNDNIFSPKQIDQLVPRQCADAHTAQLVQPQRLPSRRKADKKNLHSLSYSHEVEEIVRLL